MAAHQVAALALAACGIAAGLAGCMGEEGPRDFAPIASADWRPGYSFHYDNAGATHSHVAYTRNGHLLKAGGDSDAAASLPGLSLEVLSTLVPDGERPMYLAAAQVGETVSSLTASGRLAGRVPVGVRQADLQIVDADVHYAQACADICTTRALSLRYRDAAPYPWLRFPLVQGDQWEGPAQGTGLGHLVQDLYVRSTVAGMETIETPLGAVDAVRVEHHIEAANLEGRLAELRAEGAKRGYTDLTADATVTFVRTIHYGPQQHAVVRDASQLAVWEQVSWTQDGDRYATTIEVATDTTQSLVALKLAQYGDLSLPAALEALSPGSSATPQALGDGTSGAVAAGFTVTADRSEVNAAEQPTVTFKVTAPGGSSVGAGRRIDVVVVGPDGIVPLQQDASGAYRYNVRAMGLHTAIAQEVSGDVVTARGTAQVSARWESDALIECPAADVAFAGCPPTWIPVRPGIGHLAIDAIRSGPFVPADLRLADAAGTERQAPFEREEAYLALSEFPAGTVDQRDWMLTYEPLVASGEEVAVHITLRPATGPQVIGEAGPTLSHVALPDPWLD